MAVIRMKDHGDLRIPAEVRRRMGLQDGDLIMVEVRGRELVLTPLPPQVPFEQLLGKYADRVRRFGRLTTDDVADAVADDVLARRDDRRVR